MRNEPPAPKCPMHQRFMRYQSGEFPWRFYYCHDCNDHYRETGLCLGQVQLKRAFVISE